MDKTIKLVARPAGECKPAGPNKVNQSLLQFCTRTSRHLVNK